ncbi:MAG: hypothetical protein ACFFCD_04440 [Promethearchaeota archaeon]
MNDIHDLERSVRQNLRLINYLLWYEYHTHTENTLARFFRDQGVVKSRLDRLIELGILEQSLCNSYIVSQDPLIQAVIEYVNDNDRLIRNLCNASLAF